MGTKALFEYKKKLIHGMEKKDEVMFLLFYYFFSNIWKEKYG